MANNAKFTEGTLVVDDDEVILCYIDKESFMTGVSEREITKMIRSEDTIKYPKDEAILVKQRGEQELKQLRSNFLLNATGRNQEPLNFRLFDNSMVVNSPKKVLNVWTD